MFNSGMNSGILLLSLLNFGYIALLPRKFFKQGAKLNAQFWLTAAPLFASPLMLVLSFVGILPPWISPESPWAEVGIVLCVCLSTISIVLLGMSIGTHRIPIHMFHDQEDKKGASHLVTYGPYRFVRHPIYSSYLLALCGAFCFCPQIGTLLCWAYAIVVLSKTAAGEEARLSQSSEFGDEYVQYIKVTGRFLPPFGAFRFTENQSVHNAADNSEPQSTARQ
jgi:protein-S-isoprenylcysteine O-methyltransferase Ste14